MRNPVNRAWRAAYGQVRAGHDYSQHARNVEAGLKWTGARAWDADASVAVRDNNGAQCFVKYALPHDELWHCKHDW